MAEWFRPLAAGWMHDAMACNLVAIISYKVYGRPTTKI